MSIERTTPTILKKAGRSYTVLPNDSINLIGSGDALAIWCYLQSKPADWVVRKSDIMNRLNIGRTRYADAMKHLREIGLLAAAPNQGEDGRITGRVLICFDSPKYTETAISVAPKYTETEIDTSASFGKTSCIQIKDINTNNGLIQTEITPEKEQTDGDAPGLTGAAVRPERPRLARRPASHQCERVPDSTSAKRLHPSHSTAPLPKAPKADTWPAKELLEQRAQQAAARG